MKDNKFFLVLALFALLFVSCKKDHYDVDNVHGVNAQGEVLLPIGSKTFTMMDMMERFQVDSLISCADDGSLSFDYYYENYGVLSGDNLLRFNDLIYEDHYSASNPYTGTLPPYQDTTLNFQRTLVFEADHLSVLEAKMKSGYLSFTVNSNVGALQRVRLSTSDIVDADGNDLMMVFHPQSGTFGFDLAGLHYQTDTANSLTLEYELYCTYVPTLAPELYVDLKIEGIDLAFSEMTGYMEPYESRNFIDTTFSLFPHNVTGILDVRDVAVCVSERNTFGVDARLMVDTALVMGEGIAPYSVFEPLPLVVELPAQNDFHEVFSQNINGRITPSGGAVYASSLFTVNTSGCDDLITVSDTCNLDVRVDISLPFSFNLDDVQYLDTVNMDLAELELPDMIERLTLELTFNSTLPVDLTGWFYMYDSENEVINDTLVGEGKLIEASFDGQPTHTTISLDITEERIQKVLRSDRIIMQYVLDTEARDVKLNANQRLTLFVKAKAKYDTTVEFDK